MDSNELLVKTAKDVGRAKTVNDMLNQLNEMQKNSLQQPVGYQQAIGEMVDYLLKNF